MSCGSPEFGRIRRIVSDIRKRFFQALENYNPRNELTSAEIEKGPTNHSNRLEFEYDSQGRRISKDVYEWDSSQSLWSKVESLSFVYDGWNLVSEEKGSA